MESQDIKETKKPKGLLLHFDKWGLLEPFDDADIGAIIKALFDKEYPTYTTNMVNRDPKPVMPHIEEALDKIVEQDLKTKNLEDETSLLDAKIREFREARAVLNEAAKIIDKLYPDLIHAADETAVEIEYF